jgi:hypothetical protein
MGDVLWVAPIGVSPPLLLAETLAVAFAARVSLGKVNPQLTGFSGHVTLMWVEMAFQSLTSKTNPYTPAANRMQSS